jgi:hypothetical protein
MKEHARTNSREEVWQRRTDTRRQKQPYTHEGPKPTSVEGRIKGIHHRQKKEVYSRYVRKAVTTAKCA